VSSAPVPAKAKDRDKKGTKAKKPFWQMELGRKKGAALDDEEVEHPPFAPTLPRVNLLPPAIRQSVALRKVRRNLVAVVVLLVIAVAGVWYLQGARIAEAEDRLAVAEAEGDDLQAQVAALAPITVLATALENQKALVDATLASQPQSALVISQLAEAGREAADGNGITFSNVGVTYEGIPAAGGTLNPCPNPDPFGTEATIGCITFNANAGDRTQVSRLLEVLEADPLFVGPYVTTTSVTLAEEGGATGVTFAGTAGVSLDGLQTLLTPEQIEALNAPPEPAATQEEGESE
jgi:type IV pilus assembly protein PilN